MGGGGGGRGPTWANMGNVLNFAGVRVWRYSLARLAGLVHWAARLHPIQLAPSSRQGRVTAYICAAVLLQSQVRRLAVASLS